jgi:predicted molibdopterin-dependent oxidoreductase YjgC
MTVHLTINGKEIEAEKGKTILEAARENGIEIPTLCYHSHLHPIGSCRLCIVDIEGYPMPMASCTTPVSEGIKVHTQTGRVQKMRKEALELILVNHPLDCPVCDKGGECRLQDLAYEFEIKEQPFHAKKPEREVVSFSTPLIRQWRDRCVLCLRCVHVCHELVGNGAIDIRETGYQSVVFPVAPERCLSCGECLSVCPVGALTEAVNPFRGRVWQIEREQTTCGQCAVGCQMEISTYEGRPINIKTDNIEGQAPNFGSLCIRGRFMYDYVTHEDRLTQPKIRKGQDFAAAGWDEAYEDAINNLREVVKAHGPEAIGFITSARLTNEDLFVINKFAKSGIGTPNVDSAQRFDLAGHLPVLELLKGGKADSLDGLLNSDVIVIAGGDIDLQSQVVGNRIRTAQRFHDAKVIVVNAFKTRLNEIADASLDCAAGSEIPVFYGLLKEAFGEKGGFGDIGGSQALLKELEDYSSDAVCEAAQIDRDMFDIASALLSNKETISFVVGTGLPQTHRGLQALKALANLALAAEAAGKKINWFPLSAAANSWGAALMNSGTHVDASGAKGLSCCEMISAASEGKLKALVVIEEDPVSFFPDRKFVRDALEKLDFLMVVDLFESETAKDADLLLPSTSFMEKEGTFVNMEMVSGKIRKLIDPVGGSRSAGEIFQDIGRKMKFSLGDGFAWASENAASIVGEVFNDENSRVAGKAFFPVSYDSSRENGKNIFALVVADTIYNHHYGTAASHVAAVGKLGKRPELRLNGKDVRRLNMEDEHEIAVVTSKGKLLFSLASSSDIKEGHAVLVGHYQQTRINELFPFEFDGESGTPEIGLLRVKLEKP